VRLEGLGKLKKSTSSGAGTCDLPACSIVPQPTTPPRAFKGCGIVASESGQGSRSYGSVNVGEIS
jgi:hypothetical protein